MRFMHLVSLSVLLVLGDICVGAAGAQAIPTASKSAEISAFGGFLAAKTDYGPYAKKGFGVGGDFTIFPRFPVAPSFEVRGAEAAGPDATEKSVMFGLRIQKDLHRLHPYGDVLIGGGEIVFHPSPYPDYSADKGKAISYGGGINIDVGHHLAAKFDIQAQDWNLGANSVLTAGGGDFTLRPITALAGVTYTIPFRILNRHGDFQ